MRCLTTEVCEVSSNSPVRTINSGINHSTQLVPFSVSSRSVSSSLLESIWAMVLHGRRLDSI